VEFSYNDSYQSTIKIAPFEALHGRKCKTSLCCSDLDGVLTLGPALVQETTKRIKKIREYIQIVHSQQKSYADKKRRLLEF